MMPVRPRILQDLVGNAGRELLGGRARLKSPRVQLGKDKAMRP